MEFKLGCFMIPNIQGYYKQEGNYQMLHLLLSITHGLIFTNKELAHYLTRIPVVCLTRYYYPVGGWIKIKKNCFIIRLLFLIKNFQRKQPAGTRAIPKEPGMAILTATVTIFPFL